MNQERIDNPANPRPERRHLRRLDVNHLPMRNPVYFITKASYQRKPVLTHSVIATSIANRLGASAQFHGWSVGQYVIMPDHVHFFCRDIRENKLLNEFIRDLKKIIFRDVRNAGFKDRLWQPEFFDHVLRSQESYTHKREYVRLNPERAGLVENAKSWPWQGICEEL